MMTNVVFTARCLLLLSSFPQILASFLSISLDTVALLLWSLSSPYFINQEFTSGGGRLQPARKTCMVIPPVLLVEAGLGFVCEIPANPSFNPCRHPDPKGGQLHSASFLEFLGFPV